jgi:HAE1 family hydrophobic/amphiphilic exporter-1
MSVSDGAEWRNSLGYLIIGGLTSSTLLTLFVVPAATMVPQDISNLFGRFGKLFGGMFSRQL